jgi:CRP-like cAMP-binding protein
MAFLSDEQKQDVLRRQYLLQHLREPDVERLAQFSRVEEIKKNKPVFKKHDVGKSMYVVISGRVKITSQSIDGREIVFNIMNPGEVFGEIAFLDGLERTADAWALEKCLLLSLERRFFMPLLDRDPKMTIGIMKVLCERLRYSTEHIEDVAFLELEARLAKKLVAFAEHYSTRVDEGVKLDLSLNQAELGAMVDATREAVNRQLREWREENVIAVDKGTITITNMERLEDIADDLD